MKYKAICENHLYIKAYKKGNVYRTPNVFVYILPDRHAFLLKKQNPKKELINRIGVVTTKKVGKAVMRTRARRVIREAYRLLDKQYNIKKGYLVVLSARDRTPYSKMNEVKDDMEKALRVLGMI